MTTMTTMTTEPTSTPRAYLAPDRQPDRLHPWVAVLLALALLATWLLGYGPGSPSQLPWPALRALSADAGDAPTKSAASTGTVTAAASSPAAAAASSFSSSPASPSASQFATAGDATVTAAPPAPLASGSPPGGAAGAGAATVAEPAAAEAPAPAQPLPALEAKTAAATPAMAPVAVAQIFFPRANASLPKTVGRSLAGVVKYLKANAGATVTVAGFHDSYGDPARNAELARRRAQAVAGVLERQGIDKQRIALQKPGRSLGSGRDAQARRVDVRVVGR